ncbi:uncharacterized protein EV420DRAFT_286139 [Desarmillaria tabescens]|uniref:Uncharacterized protein n=1 Tax=Armillaria tabescens TaxID=1929756 RepID=A0AA39KEK2_ARMTA|nr:uncharacterized protein EV420DRAFT_286139 [Desarmillaria tabescens]KAK0459726.1 hypothetical protein EV420DRAFT_286139 [Desarmillaria tabescens]
MSAELSPPKAKRRGTKRPNVAFSDDDNDTNDGARDYPHSPKRARIHSTEPDTATDHHLPQHSPESSPNVGRSDVAATKKSRKRKPSARFVDEDDDYDVNIEDDDDELLKTASAIPDGFDDDEEFIDDDEDAPVRGSKKGKTKGAKAAGKGKGKTKAKSEVKEVKMKDERKIIPKPIPSAAQPPSSKRPKVPGTGDAPGGGDSATTQLMKDDHPTQAPKKKLPTIKKNKELGAAGPSTPSVAKSTSSAPTAPKDEFSLTNTLTPASRKPPLVSGGDLDLSNSSVYSSLFKPTANTPRTASNRDAERRKELNKLREEARAKRELEANYHFDLQGDMEKILRFEDRLRSIRSPTVYPNVLGAKWKEQWERDKRHRVQPTSRDVDGGREEGEM